MNFFYDLTCFIFYRRSLERKKRRGGVGQRLIMADKLTAQFGNKVNKLEIGKVGEYPVLYSWLNLRSTGVKYM
jgi:hypothetical protein